MSASPGANRRQLKPREYTVGWISALPIEYAAATEMLDERHEPPARIDNDDTLYTLGQIHGHNIVLACLPAGVIGTVSAAVIATYLGGRFPNARIGLMVGVGGGVPSPWDIRLGDVVVSHPGDGHGGVVQYDMGKRLPNGQFAQTSHLNKPPTILLNALAEVQRRHFLDEGAFLSYLSRLEGKPKFSRQRAGLDRLYRPDYQHQGSSCVSCDIQNLIEREDRAPDEMVQIHYGTIASANSLIKDGVERERICEALGGNIRCFEMEAAGLMNNFPCLIIRGICDYADSHKNKMWQPYAAATAAAYAKELLSVIPPNKVADLAPMKDIHFLVPFGRNNDFVRRDEIIMQLLEKVPPQKHKDECQWIAVEGLGGIGKTQLALEIAYRVRDQYPDCSVFWVPIVDATSFENAYRTIGEAFGIAGLDDDKADVKLLVQRALCGDKSGNWLMIIDNADDNELIQTLSPFFPTARTGSILFTTRNHAAVSSLDIPPHRTIIVKAMKREEALKMLARNMTSDQLEDTTSTSELLDFLEDLPLAIRQASAYMWNNGISTTTYLGLCRSSDTDKIDLLSRHFSDRHRYKDMEKQQNPIATTWLISFEQLASSCPHAADCLKAMCFLAEKAIPVSLLPDVSKIKMEEAIGALKGYAFIVDRKDQHIFDIHRLVRLTMRNWLETQGEQRKWVITTIELVSRKFPSPKHENRHIWTGYLPHAQKALETRNDPADGKAEFTDDKAEWRLLFNVAECNSILGKYGEAEQMYRLALKRAEEVLGQEHPFTLDTMNNLAIVFGRKGEYEKAQNISRQTLEQGELVLDRNHPSILTSITTLAEVFTKQGKYDEAEQMHRKVLKLREETSGQKHTLTLDSMDDLGVVLCCQGKYGEAEQMHQKTLKLREEICGQRHPSICHSLINLASAFSRQGKDGEAEQLYQRVLNLREQVLGPEHPDTLSSMNNLAEIFRNRGKYGEAELLSWGALKLQAEILGRKHPSTLQSMANLGLVMLNQGRYNEAEQLHRPLLNLKEEVLSPKNPSTLQSMDNLGLVLLNRGKYDETEQILRRTWHLRTEVLGRTDPLTLESMDNLGIVRSNQGKHAEAEQIHRQALHLMEEALGRKHVVTIDSRNNLGVVLYNQGKYDEAEQTLQQALHLYEEVYGGEHPKTILCKNNLQACLQRNKKRKHPG